MNNVSLESIPQELKNDKSVVPYVSRSVELESINPIVSFYCKIYVLEHILSNKLHTKDKEVEKFTIILLDETEQLKSTEDESLHKVLNDKTLSLSAVMSFAYQIFNQCLQDLQRYDGTTKPQLVSKFKAGLNFMNLLSIFTNSSDAIDYSKLTGGKATDSNSFAELNKSKIKLLKFQLSKILKDQVEVHDQGLEAELDRELENMGDNGADNDVQDDAEDKASADNELGLPGAPKSINEDTNDNELGLPVTPKFIDDNNADDANKETKKEENGKSNDTTKDEDISLPKAPHFAPDDEDDDIKLPGAPKFLPDNDFSHINKSSSIQVFPPGKPEDDNKAGHAPSSIRSPSTSSIPPSKPASSNQGANPQHQHLTKENVSSMVDKADQITKIQKHAKFAISALNYDDLDTAERELLQGLELLRAVKD
ncbi:uncharacterized protein AC631_00061 [Debaryomyces fabryi]|uniref:Vta1 C-terminal domain-containing protein n=1 Tax=Debaryomyces fabryi TaxID=58627 RepID=A0A0V1Q6Q0_9ASCO|nr:uncharacterized protein AC631_00061 [Debaryomyces fabryi]KSA04190.1 hypothetical protein AC631_00061 [Debaryomyces fabryi]CUM46247.1 unnamed protein product [Debaryomyces fabryi]